MPGIDYNQVIQQALQPVAPTLAAKPPALTTGAPLIPENNLQQIISQALQPGGVPQTRGDRADAMIKLGTALMQPRQPGQSVAGNIGTALSGTVDYMNQQKTQRNALAQTQAQLANQVASADLARKNTQMNMQILATQFPTEFAMLQQKLRKAMLEGKADDVAYIKNLLAMENGAQYILRTMQADLSQKEATVGYTEALGDAARGRADLNRAQADYFRNYGKSDPTKQVRLGNIDLPDGSHVEYYGQGGAVYAITTTPAMDAKKAMKKAEDELRKESGTDGTWSLITGQGPTQQQIAERAKQYMSPKTETTMVQGPPAGTPGAPRTTARTTGATPTGAAETPGAPPTVFTGPPRQVPGNAPPIKTPAQVEADIRAGNISAAPGTTPTTPAAAGPQQVKQVTRTPGGGLQIASATPAETPDNGGITGFFNTNMAKGKAGRTRPDSLLAIGIISGSKDALDEGKALLEAANDPKELDIRLLRALAANNVPKAVEWLRDMQQKRVSKGKIK